MGSTNPLSERIRASLEAELERAREAYSGSEALHRILELLTAAVEVQFDGQMLASILLLDAESQRLMHGAAPSLPSDYNKAIDGVKIGPRVGSCGTAAYLRRPIYVSDIATDPLWEDFKDLAARYDLRACWSTPIPGHRRPVVGTFALYYRTPRNPTDDEIEAIGQIVDTAADVVEQYGTA